MPFSRSEQGFLDCIVCHLKVPSMEWCQLKSLDNQDSHMPNSPLVPLECHKIYCSSCQAPSLSDCLSLFLPRHHRGQVWADLLCGWHHDQADWSEWDHLNGVGFQWLDICSASQLWLCYGHFSGKTVVWFCFYRMQAYAFTLSACLWASLEGLTKR